MVDLNRLETDLYNEIMEMRAKERKRVEDRENTLKTLKFVAIIGAYVIVSVFVLSLLFMFLRHQFPEYFTKGTVITKEVKKIKSKEVDHNITVSNVSPVTQNVVINVYNNGVLHNVPINKYRDGNQTVIDIGKPIKKKKTIEELKKDILNDESLCNHSVIDSVNQANIALKAYEREDLKAFTIAVATTEKKTEYSSKVCKNIMSNAQLNENINTGKQHLKLLRQYEKNLKSLNK